MNSLVNFSLSKTQNLGKIVSMSNELCAIETRRKIALSATGIGIWEWNLMTNKIIWDETMHKIYKADKTFIPTFDSIMAFVHKDDIVKTIKIIEDFKTDKFKTKISMAFRIKWGNEFRWVLSVCQKILNSNDQIVKVIGTNQLLERNIRVCEDNCNCAN